MKKKLWLIMLIVAALLGLSTLYAGAASGADTVTLYVDTSDSFQSTWDNAITQAVLTKKPVEIVLRTDANMTAACAVTGNITVTSDSGSIYTITPTTDNANFAVNGGMANGELSSLTLENITIDRSTPTTGNIIVVTNGHLYLENGATLTGNRSSAIVVAGLNAFVTMNGGKISGNSNSNTSVTGVGSGAGVFMGNSCTFNMYGGEISGNTAGTNGGGVYAHGGTFNMYGGEISGNYGMGAGGGVYMGSCVFNMYGGEISDNYGGSMGGGVYLNTGGQFIMSGGTISGNTAANGGGGVYVYTMGSLTMNGGTIGGTAANTTSVHGGGVYVYTGGTVTITNGTISKNTAASGGGLHSSGTVTMEGGNISGNTATTNGGGVCIDTDSTFNMTGGTIGGTAADDANSANSAGGVYINSSATFNMSGTAAVNGNKATTNGGGVFIHTGSTFNMSGTAAISGNTATSGTSATNGGGVYLNTDSTLTMTGTSSISGNTANSYGGGVYSLGAFNMENGTVSGNKAARGSGVCVTTTSASFAMKGGSISNNTCTEFSGSGIDSNDGHGGAVCVFAGASFTMSDGQISGNSSTTNAYGGGVWVNNTSSTFTMTGGTIGGTADADKNTALHGGGVYVIGGTFTMSGGTITGNTVTAGGGGVALNTGSTFTMTGGTISNNTATNGGGVTIWAATFTMSGSAGTISGNTATGVGGGGVAVHTNSIFTMEDGKISGNKATATNGGGGGVRVGTSGTFNMEGGSVTGNTATTTGGGVYVETSGTINLSGTPVVKENKHSDGSLNNVYHYSGTIKVTAPLTNGAEVWIKYPGTMGATFATASTADDATASAQYFHNDADSACPAAAQGTNLIWGEYVAQILESGSLKAQYFTLNDAVAAYENFSTQMIQLLKDITAPSTISKDVYLDLNGHNITGTLTVNSGYTLHGLDCTTDGYTASSYGKISGTISGTGTVATVTQTATAHTSKVKSYLKVTEDDGVSFHRFNVQVSDYYFRLVFDANDTTNKGSAIINFNSAVQGNSKVADAITGLEQSSSATDVPEKNNQADSTALDDLRAALKAGTPYYHRSHFIFISNPYTDSRYSLTTSLTFGTAGPVTSTKNRTLRDILSYFYKDATQEQQTVINEFLTRNSLSPLT